MPAGPGQGAAMKKIRDFMGILVSHDVLHNVGVL